MTNIDVAAHQQTAAWRGAWEIVPTGVLATILVAVEAGQVHEAEGRVVAIEVDDLTF